MHVGESAEKKDVLERLLELGMVLVALDARADGVDVPDHLGRDPQLRLNLSYRFGLPMALDPWGISATLTFGGVPYACRFPWGAIYLLVSHVNGEPYLFPDEVPPELLAQVGVEGAWSLPAQKARPAAAKKPKLSLVVAPADDEADGEGEGDVDAHTDTPADTDGKAGDAPEQKPRAPRHATPTPVRSGEPRRTGGAAKAVRSRATGPQRVPDAVDDGDDPEAPAKDAIDGVEATPAPAAKQKPSPAKDAEDDKRSAGDGEVPKDGGPGKRRGHLRLVK